MTRSTQREAERDLSDAFRFYEREAGRGVALRFLDEFERTIRLLQEQPELGVPSRENRRSFSLSHFPYSIVYRSTDRGIRVLVVRHHSRSPEHGESRR